MDCTHTGPHLLLLNATVGVGGDYRIIDAVTQALHHVDDPDLTLAQDMATVETILARAKAAAPKFAATDTRAYAVEVDDRELTAMRAVVMNACEYMTDNDYGRDGYFPEDQACARVLGSWGTPATMCWVEALGRVTT